jgi:hypothetical protein
MPLLPWASIIDGETSMARSTWRIFFAGRPPPGPVFINLPPSERQAQGMGPVRKAAPLCCAHQNPEPRTHRRGRWPRSITPSTKARRQDAERRPAAGGVRGGGGRGGRGGWRVGIWAARAYVAASPRYLFIISYPYCGGAGVKYFVGAGVKYLRRPENNNKNKRPPPPVLLGRSDPRGPAGPP